MLEEKFNDEVEPELKKIPTGIRGLDDIMFGGLPKGRTALLAGGPGSGKTLLSVEFLVRGAMDFGEPGLFVAFEESPKELSENASSLGFHLKNLISQKKLAIDQVRVERNEIEETGEYDLEGLFVRLNYGIESIGAKRVVLDTIESLFAGLSNEAILRAELRRLFRWLKEKGVTAVVTAEKGPHELTRYGLEEYVSDCVILLDHRVRGQVSTRRLRVLKYRGSRHGTNEYPFLIDERGITILPITSVRLDYPVSRERISSGIPKLDAMLEEKGFYRGSSILVSGTPGTGKSTLCAQFASATCARGERCLYFAFEESPDQIVRNMLSVGIDLSPSIKSGLLEIHASRSTIYGLENHLVTMQKVIETFDPSAVIVDPVTSFVRVGGVEDVISMLTRLIDYMKGRGITTLFTDLTDVNKFERTEEEISSVMDTWIVMRDTELSGERNRTLHVLKSRGMAHSNQIREYKLTSTGIDLLDVYLGPAGVLTGSARMDQEAREKASHQMRGDKLNRLNRELERDRQLMEAEIAVLKSKYESKEEEISQAITREELEDRRQRENRKDIEKARRAQPSSSSEEK